MSKQHEDDAIKQASGNHNQVQALRAAYRWGMERAAQKVRYYLKHQNISSFTECECEEWVVSTCHNVETVINNEVTALNQERPVDQLTEVKTFWCVVAKKDGEETILFQYARRSKVLSRNAVRDYAWKTERFTGTTELRLKQLGWEIREFTAFPE